MPAHETDQVSHGAKGIRAQATAKADCVKDNRGAVRPAQGGSSDLMLTSHKIHYQTYERAHARVYAVLLSVRSKHLNLSIAIRRQAPASRVMRSRGLSVRDTLRRERCLFVVTAAAVGYVVVNRV